MAQHLFFSACIAPLSIIEPSMKMRIETYSYVLLLILACWPDDKQCDAVKQKQTKSTTVTTTPSTVAPERPPLVLEAVEKNRPIYYFGLGSNMLREKVENRAIDGSKIKIQSMKPAVVPNYRLAFNMRGFPPLEPGMGSLEPVNPGSSKHEINDKYDSASSTESYSRPLLAYKNAECHGALIKLDPENYEKVMRSEGVGSGRADQGYEEIVVEAYPYENVNHNNRSILNKVFPPTRRRQRQPVLAVALRAREHVRLDVDPCPSERYMTILRTGAKELGLKECYQDFLEKHPVQQLPQWLRKVAIYNLLTTFTISFKLKWRGISRIQSWFLYRVHLTQANPNRLVKLLSDVTTAFILLPGAIIGFVVIKVIELTGNEPPPMVNRIKQRLGGEKQEADNQKEDDSKKE